MTTQIGMLIVGNEILDGLVLDTNSQWMINRLKALSFDVKERVTVRDEVAEIARALRRLVADGCDIVFIDEAMRKAHDDKTLNGVAQAFGLPLELNEEALGIIVRQYRDLHSRGVIDDAEITDARRKMAVLPRGARPLDNRVGGAPAVLLGFDGGHVVSLPGVPGELMWIFDNQVMPLLKKRVEGVFVEKIIFLPLRDESTLAPIIDEAMRKAPDVYIKSMVKPYGESGIRLWVSARGQSQAEVEARVERVANLLIQLCEDRLPGG